MTPPNWFRLNGGMGSVGLSKKFFASSAELRRNSNTSPWILFVPVWLTALIMPPIERPYSAGALWVITLNSLICSQNFTPGGAGGLMFGVESIKEFKVISHNAPAEYGCSMGGIINAVSHTSTNCW